MRISMRTLFGLFVVLCFAGGVAVAQPAGSAAPAAPDAAPAGSAAPDAAPMVAGPSGHPVDAATADKRKVCAEAMNADPSFALAIVKTINDKTAQQHVDAAGKIAKNEKHVVLAYAAMWVIAAAFVLFLWRRQQHLKSEIAHLRRDLDAATKDASEASGK